MTTPTPLPLPLNLLAVARLGIGTAGFLFPSLTTTTLFCPTPTSSLLHVRLWGCRDALLATLLYTARSPEARRRAVLAGAAVDALDLVAGVWGYGKGEVEGLAASAFGGGAVGFLALAAIGWRVGGLGVLGKVAGKS